MVNGQAGVHGSSREWLGRVARTLAVQWSAKGHGSSGDVGGMARVRSRAAGVLQVEGQACAKVLDVGRVLGGCLSPLLAARACELTLKGWLMELSQVDYRLGLVSARRVAAGSPGLELVWVDKTVASWDCLKKHSVLYYGKSTYKNVYRRTPSPGGRDAAEPSSCHLHFVSKPHCLPDSTALYLPRPLGLFLGARQGALFPCPLWSPMRHFWGSALIGQGDRAWCLDRLTCDMAVMRSGFGEP